MRAHPFPTRLLSHPRPPLVATMNERRGRRIKPLPSTPPPPNPNPNPKCSTVPSVPARRSLPLGDGPHGGAWEPLHLPRSELSLPLTLPTGQTFRWRRTSPGLFTGVVGPHLVSLSHLPDDPRGGGGGGVAFLLHGGAAAPASAAARAAVADYLNVGVPLAELWRGFAAADPRFAELAETLGGGGARVLRQDPVECLFQFLCSSNNNIGRIEKMVGVLSSFGNYLGSVGGFDFHEFPSIDRLSLVSESALRETGFGYRAKYIVGTAKALSAKPGGGAEWLSSLRRLDLDEVIDALCTLPGVGPKVAACVALFSLDQHHAIPVDTHVWQIATRYFTPELAGKSLTPKLCSRVADAFVTKFGKYAGWAQNVLFIGELSSQKVILSSANNTVDKKESTKRKRRRNNIVVAEALCGE